MALHIFRTKDKNNLQTSKTLDELESDNVIEFVKRIKAQGDKLELCYHNALTDYSQYIIDVTLKDCIEELLKTAIVVLTANIYERNVLNFYFFQDNQCEKIKRFQIRTHNNMCFEAFLIKTQVEQQPYILHIHASTTGSYTPGGSSDVLRYLQNNEYISPKFIISFGICYGQNNKEQSLGDVIIARKLYPYSVGVKIGETYQIRDDSYIIDLSTQNGISLDIYQRIADMIAQSSFVRDDTIISNVEYGNMVTGEAVISNREVKELFTKASHIIKPCGGEMEGYGMAKECYYYNKVPCMLIKSICDWGVSKNIDDLIEEKTGMSYGKDKIQAYSAYCAFTVLNKLLKECGVCFGQAFYDEVKQIFISKKKSRVLQDVRIEEIIREIKPNISNEGINAICKSLENEQIWKLQKQDEDRAYCFI